MEIFYQIKPHLLKSSAVALGFFDGVHLGHQAVIATTIKEARSKGITPAVVTFKDHPRALTDGNSPLLLTVINQRLAIFEKLGVEAALVLTFTEELCKLSAREYVETVLVGSMGAKVISVGFNHHFGRRREGDPQLLIQFGQALDFTVQIARPVFLDNVEVSSSKIRESLNTANLDLANKLLSRPFSMLGKVITGEGRGTKLGFPTANLQTSPFQTMPAVGVYAVKVRVSDENTLYSAVVNIGHRPTFNEQQDATMPLLEVHILNFQGDLYNKNLEVYFHKYLRPEKKFSELEALKDQIRTDCDIAQKYLSSAH